MAPLSPVANATTLSHPSPHPSEEDDDDDAQLSPDAIAQPEPADNGNNGDDQEVEQEQDEEEEAERDHDNDDEDEEEDEDDDDDEEDEDDEDEDDDDEDDEPQPALAVTRERRDNAGSRMAKLIELASAEEAALASLAQEEEGAEGYADIFQEAADDLEFEGAGDDEADAYMSSSESEDEDAAAAAGGGDADDEEGGRELRRDGRVGAPVKKRKRESLFQQAMRLKRLKHAPVLPVAAPQSDATTAAAQKPKKKSERVSWLPDDGQVRSSTRSLAVANKEATHQRLKESEKRREKTLAMMQAAEDRKRAKMHRVMTQEERLAQAAIIEEHNSSSLNRWEEAEKRRQEEQKARLDALKNRRLDGPVVTYWSGPGVWINDKLKQVGKSRLVEVIEAERDGKPKITSDLPPEAVDIVIDDTPSEQKANDTVATTDNQENKEQAQSADVVMGDTLSEPKVNDATATIENQEPKESMEPKEQEEAVDQDIVMNDAPSEPKANDPIATAEIHELNEQGDTTALPDAVNSSDVMEISEDTKLEKTGNTAESVPTSEKTPPLDGTENGVLSSNDKTESASQIEKPTSKTPEATVLDNEANTEPKDSHQSPTDQPTDQPTATLNSTSTPPALNDTASSLQPPLTTAVSEEVTGDTIAATEENLLNSEAPAMENEPVPPPIRTVALRSLVTLNSFPNLSRHSTRIHHSPPHQDSPTVEKHTARSSRAQDRDVAHLLRAIFSVPPPSLDPNQAPPSSTDDSATATDNQKQPFAPYDPLIPASGGPRHSTRYLSKRATPCPITGSVARYRDPVTGLPYANAPAFRMLRAVAMDGHGVWSGLLQAWVGEDRRAKGVPSEVWEGTVELKAGDENGAADKEDGIKAK